jgi:hypothetical protein
MTTDAEIRSRLSGAFQRVLDDDSIKVSNAVAAKDVAEWDPLNRINLLHVCDRLP